LAAIFWHKSFPVGSLSPALHFAPFLGAAAGFTVDVPFGVTDDLGVATTFGATVLLALLLPLVWLELAQPLCHFQSKPS
jgi:hypothetical protein